MGGDDDDDDDGVDDARRLGMDIHMSLSRLVRLTVLLFPILFVGTWIMFGLLRREASSVYVVEVGRTRSRGCIHSEILYVGSVYASSLLRREANSVCVVEARHGK